jgi:multiple sugar transport system permease protein
MREDVTREDSVFKQVFLSPTVLLLLAFSIFPLVWALGISFTDYQRGASVTARAGETVNRESENLFERVFGVSLTLRNYERIPTDPRLRATLENTLFYVFLGVTVQYIFGLGLAMLLNQPFLGRSLVRVIFLMPMMMTPVATAYTARMLLDANPTRGPVAHLIRITEGQVESFLPDSVERALKMDDDKAWTVPWFTQKDWAPFAMVVADSWQWIPFMTLILLAGLQAIPDDIYEAARVDGANAFTIFLRITFPLLLPISVTVILIRGLEIFKIIDVIQITTGGGPGSATESLTMYIKDTALAFGNYGYAAAISFMLLVLVIIFSTLFLALGRLASRASGSG